MNGMPFGARFGTLVHEVLEHVDTAADDRSAHRARCARRAPGRTAFDIDVDALAVALEGAHHPAGIRRSVGGPADRLSEMEFELPRLMSTAVSTSPRWRR